MEAESSEATPCFSRLWLALSSIAAAVQNGRPIWVSHKTASAMLLRKLCWFCWYYLLVMILRCLLPTTWTTNLLRPLWIFLCLLLDQIPVCGLRTFCDLSGFPLPTTWSDPRLRYSPILCAPVCTISIHPGTYWPDPRLHHHHHRHHHHHDHLRCQPTQPTP